MVLIEQFSASVNTVIDSQLIVELTQSVADSFCVSSQVLRDNDIHIFESFPFAKMANENVKKLKAIIERANKSNINIQRLPAVRNHLKPSNLSFFIVIPIAFGFIAFIHSKSWMNDGKKCWISLPDSISHAFRPPEDCGFCKNITQADRVSNISPTEFERKYAYNAKPVVVTDATTNWSALNVFDFWYFKDVYDSFNSEQMNCQFFPVNDLKKTKKVL